MRTGTVSRWIAQIKGGDELALAQLHQRYWPQLVRIARRRINRVTFADRDAEDVAQEAFLAMYQSLSHGRTPQLVNRHQWLAFLSHLIACRVVTEIRRAVSQKRLPVDLQQLPPRWQRDSPLHRAMVHDCFEFYIGSLPEQLRPFAQMDLAGFTGEEIAEQLNCTRRTVQRKRTLLKMYWQAFASQSEASATERFLARPWDRWTGRHPPAPICDK